MSRAHRVGDRVREAPDLHRHVLGQRRRGDFVPADLGLAQLGQDRTGALVERRFHLDPGLEAVGGHVVRDRGIRHPGAVAHLVAADVEIAVRKKRGHFAEQALEKPVGRLAGRVQRRIVGGPRLGGIGLGGKLRIGLQDGGGVRRDVDLGHDAYAAVGGIGDQITDLGLGVELAVGGDLRQLRIALALDPEALVVREVEVQDVELHTLHGVDLALHRGHGHEVPRGVDHHAAPGKARMVVDAHERDRGRSRAAADQLAQSRQAVQDPGRTIGLQLHPVGGDRQAIGFLGVQRQVARILGRAVDGQGRATLGRQGPQPGRVGLEADDRLADQRTRTAGGPHLEGRGKGQGSRIQRHRLRLGKQDRLRAGGGGEAERGGKGHGGGEGGSGEGAGHRAPP